MYTLAYGSPDFDTFSIGGWMGVFGCVEAQAGLILCFRGRDKGIDKRLSHMWGGIGEVGLEARLNVVKDYLCLYLIRFFF
mmetsp:Transcript_43759/g.114129  ORF Transcript_43759/g.114129 Transcript_43759/m.114129 type:complete len:80 (+) Transcript_43759:1186-1425(+)